MFGLVVRLERAADRSSTALAGLAACAWLRELGLPRGPALAGGLAFAIAPYRVEQSVGHLLGPISILLPLSLWAFERARRGSAWWLVLAGAALASIPLSGQVHLALGAIPFFLALRARAARAIARLWLGAGAGAVAAIGAGLLVRATLIEESTQSGGRSLDEISHYSAHVGDFVSRHVDHGRSEQFVFLGWATPLVALAGLVLLVRARRYALAAILGVGALVPIVLALGTHTPIYDAALARPTALPLPARAGAPAADRLPVHRGAVRLRASREQAHGRHGAAQSRCCSSTCTRTSTASRRPAILRSSAVGRRAGCSSCRSSIPACTTAASTSGTTRRRGASGRAATRRLRRSAAKAVADRLERLNCGDWSGDMAGELKRLGVGAIALHRGLYVRNPAVPTPAGSRHSDCSRTAGGCSGRPGRSGSSSGAAAARTETLRAGPRAGPSSARAGSATRGRRAT